MADHLRQLRLYYLAVKHRLDVRGRVRVDWSADMVVEWMRTLRLQPYEDATLCSVSPGVGTVAGRRREGSSRSSPSRAAASRNAGPAGQSG